VNLHGVTNDMTLNDSEMCPDEKTKLGRRYQSWDSRRGYTIGDVGDASPTSQSTIFNIISYIMLWHCKVMHFVMHFLSFSTLISSLRHVVTFGINRSALCSFIIWKIKPLCHWALCRTRMSGHKSGVQVFVKRRLLLYPLCQSVQPLEIRSALLVCLLFY